MADEVAAGGVLAAALSTDEFRRGTSLRASPARYT